MTVQTLVIRAWHPRTNPNGSHDHWRTHQKKHDIDRDMAWASAMQAGWTFVPGKVKLTITLVYPRNTLPDPDNAVARCKGLIDGLKNESSPYIHTGRSNCCRRWREDKTCRYLEKGPERICDGRQGFITDDSTEWLDLEVRAVVEPGVKEVRISLAPAEVLA